MSLIKKNAIKKFPPVLGNFFTETLFPSFCYNCKKPGTYLCRDCFWQLRVMYEPACPHCDLRVPFGELPGECRRETGLHRIFTPGLYSDKALGSLVKDLKYKYAHALARPLAEFALWHLEQAAYADIIKEKIDVVVPAPLHKKKLKKRGFNQAELIAEYLGRYFDIPVNTDILIKIKKTDSQVETGSRKEREQNLEGAFIAEGDALKGKTVLLVDDVITTGSTLRQCAKVLRESGAREVWGFAILKD